MLGFQLRSGQSFSYGLTGSRRRMVVLLCITGYKLIERHLIFKVGVYIPTSRCCKDDGISNHCFLQSYRAVFDFPLASLEV